MSALVIEQHPVPRGVRASRSRRTELIGQLRPGTEDSIFFPVPKALLLDPARFRSNITRAAWHHGWRLTCRVLEEDGVLGVRVWRRA